MQYRNMNYEESPYLAFVLIIMSYSYNVSINFTIDLHKQARLAYVLDVNIISIALQK